MDYNKISELLEKYWEGESSLEEEATLRSFFSITHRDLPEHLREAAPLFQFFHEEAAGETVELPEWEFTQEQPETPVVKMNPFRNWMKYAAILLMAIGIGHAVRQHQQQQQVAMQQDKAFEETKNALRLLAKNLNKGTSQMQKLSYFNDATEKIEGNN
ncbi:hypothetical protein [Chitinophaga vietnamensis]|uniref:hypothetical protein n=1 Tax=Chitinophaga vietnamensis TaxID=2593957 RepID=UPI0011786FC9|nr:hypothetical protein [Chitinophaga vietnamensis]